MPYKPPLPDLSPDLTNVRAVITTRWHGKGYRPLTISSLENYYVDTALDNDSDVWQVAVGDPNGKYMDLLDRNNEIRVVLYGVGHEGLGHMMNGIGDEAVFENGVWTITGRDLSSLAVDSTPLPHRWAKARAWAIVKRQAHNIGFHNTQLARTGIVKKLQYTDGSESYWDFWYRLYRQEKMWLWTLPNGTLVGDKLNYGDDPIYYLGDAKSTDGDHITRRIIPAITVVASKSTQNRIHEVVIYGSRGDVGFNIKVDDPTTAKWQKRVRKVMLDTTSRTPQAAKRMGWEEIFEGKVGSVEIKVTIPDPGFVLQQNQIARLYIKDIDLLGEFFVVGSRIQGGPDGFVQEVRLRERDYAISARVPTAPKLKTGQPGTAGSTSLGKALEQSGLPHGWGDYFIKAAKKYHGVMDYSLFLACLLGICHVETGFQNERQNGGPGGDHIEWYPYDPNTPRKPEPGVPGRTGGPAGSESRSEYERKFANQPGVYGITQYHPWGPPPGQGGVGPMQLTSIGLKQSADDLLRPGHRSQYEGGRWHPEHNIMIGARTLHNDCEGVRAARDNDIWLAVDAYNMGVGAALANYRANGAISSYAEKVKRAVMKDPGYLAQVQAGIKAGAGAGTTQGRGFTNPFPNGWVPNRLDMGWDGTFTQKIVAPFPGTIMYAGLFHGWQGRYGTSHGIIIHSDIPFGLNLSKTNTLFFAEGLIPTVKAGDKVHAGQTIARAYPSPYNRTLGNIEFGLAQRGKVGVQTDTAALAVGSRQGKRDLVMEFYHWAKNTLHVPGQATDFSSAGVA